MSDWVSVNVALPAEDEHVQLLHRDGTQWVGMRRIERPTFEETFTPYSYFIDRAERETWEREDITHWAPLRARPENALVQALNRSGRKS